MARVDSVRDDGQGGRTLAIRETGLEGRVQIGESIAINGVCLTVVSDIDGRLTFQVGPETVRRTTLGSIHDGDRVNIEPALRVGDSLGGHFVSGHVDTMGRIAERIPSGDWQTVWFEIPREFDPLMVTKGSIAIDGISLTLVDVLPGRVSVMLIPHTLAVTTLGLKGIGDPVNLEFDMLAKQVQKLLQSMTLRAGGV